jgi:hypothetical protein
LDSLRDFARRRYTGQPGKVYCISKATVEVAIYAPICQAENLMHRMTHELIKTKEDGEADGTDHQMALYHIPAEFHLRDSVGERTSARSICRLDRRT